MGSTFSQILEIVTSYVSVAKLRPYYFCGGVCLLTENRALRLEDCGPLAEAHGTPHLAGVVLRHLNNLERNELLNDDTCPEILSCGLSAFQSKAHI